MKKYFLFTIVLLLVSCSKSNSNEDNLNGEVGNTDKKFPKIIAVAENMRTFYSIEISSNSNGYDLTNLSEALELPYSYSDNNNISLNGAFFTFGSVEYDVENGSYIPNVIQKDFSTNESSSFNDFCSNDLAANFLAPEGSKKYLSYFYINSETDSGGEAKFTYFNKSTQSCLEFSLGNGLFYNSRQIEDYFLGYRLTPSFERELWIVNLRTGSIPKKYNLENGFNFATTYSDMLFICYDNGDYQVYDMESNALLLEKNNSIFSDYYGHGVFSTDFINGEMLFYVFDEENFPQIPFKPILFNIEDNKVTDFEISFGKLYNHILEKYDGPMNVVNYTYDNINELMLVVYKSSENGTGVILYCDLKGEILKEVVLPYGPTLVNIIN